jgi:hypothetical protein
MSELRATCDRPFKRHSLIATEIPDVRDQAATKGLFVIDWPADALSRTLLRLLRLPIKSSLSDMISTAFDRKLAHAAIVLVIGSIIGSGPLGSGIAGANDVHSLVADNAAPASATSMTTIPMKHRYWRHRGGKHPHFGSRRVSVPQSSTSLTSGR